MTTSFPLNTTVEGLAGSGGPTYIVKTPMLARRWITTITKCEPDGSLRRIAQIHWRVGRSSVLRFGTKQAMLDEYLVKPRWYSADRVFRVNAQLYQWQRNCRPLSSPTITNMTTGEMIAILRRTIFGTPVFNFRNVQPPTELLDACIVTGIVLEHRRQMRRF
ncbi:hypothetical protein EXIGLDRAFT_828435 [Exidia glandulosa HHB12029]|uniref:DUF6593 domain-containing protein n=1 Tax=Exidia glandulosa HHB12029 TaxID=1314781 RepID=A0A165QG71_EXIGL|nr:hypothetical protein EXIGLDRAFT_828435 [Exidia glandulosa HHB12029]